MSTAVDVARAALREVGRGDLAERVNENRGGWPTMVHHDHDRDVVVRAFWLGHVTSHPTAVIAHDEATDGSCILCDVCEGRW